MGRVMKSRLHAIRIPLPDELEMSRILVNVDLIGAVKLCRRERRELEEGLREAEYRHFAHVYRLALEAKKDPKLMNNFLADPEWEERVKVRNPKNILRLTMQFYLRARESGSRYKKACAVERALRDLFEADAPWTSVESYLQEGGGVAGRQPRKAVPGQEKELFPDSDDDGPGKPGGVGEKKRVDGDKVGDDDDEGDEDSVEDDEDEDDDDDAEQHVSHPKADRPPKFDIHKHVLIEADRRWLSIVSSSIVGKKIWIEAEVFGKHEYESKDKYHAFKMLRVVDVRRDEP